MKTHKYKISIVAFYFRDIVAKLSLRHLKYISVKTVYFRDILSFSLSGYVYFVFRKIDLKI